MTNAWIDYTKELCDRSTSDPENSEFILSFDKRIATLDFLTDQEKEDYKAENKKIVLEEVVPAYKKLAKEVQKYRGKAKDDDYLLYKLDKNYAELQFMLAFSCNKSIDEIYADVEDAYSLLEAEFVSVYYDELSNNQFNAALNGEIDVLKLDHKGMLEYLRTHNGDYFPDLGDVEYEVSYLNPDTASNGTASTQRLLNCLITLIRTLSESIRTIMMTHTVSTELWLMKASRVIFIRVFIATGPTQNLIVPVWDIQVIRKAGLSTRPIMPSDH